MKNFKLILFGFYFTIMIISAGATRQVLGKCMFKRELHGHLNWHKKYKLHPL